jgi:hypothetical protein
MNKECFIDDLIETSEKKIVVCSKKRDDYARDSDCLANFKVMSAIARVMKQHGYEIDITKAWGVAMWHLLHKFVRIVGLYNIDAKPNNESATDSHLDLELYSALAKACYEEAHREDVILNPTSQNAINPT